MHINENFEHSNQYFLTNYNTNEYQGKIFHLLTAGFMYMT